MQETESWCVQVAEHMTSETSAAQSSARPPMRTSTCAISECFGDFDATFSRFIGGGYAELILAVFLPAL